MIRIFGDVHAKFWNFKTKLEHTPDNAHVIQVGDMGIWHDTEEKLKKHPLPRNVYFCDGNHENFEILWESLDDGHGDPFEIFPNLTYVPRGNVVEIDGRNILFLGGAESPDAHMRLRGRDWWPEESIRYKDVMQIDLNTQVDLMISHVPPYEIAKMMNIGADVPEWNASAKLVGSVWDALGRPPLYCGHFHINKSLYGVTIINELNYVDI